MLWIGRRLADGMGKVTECGKDILRIPGMPDWRAIFVE